MSFLKRAYLAITDKWEIKSPIVYHTPDANLSISKQLTRLAETVEVPLDLEKLAQHQKSFCIGESGEQQVLFELQHANVPMLILEDVYIEYDGFQAQLDFILITRQFIQVVEVKRLYGNIHVTDRGEFQRVIMKGNRVVNKEGMYSPINQVKRHLGILEKLLKDNKMINVCPLTYTVTLANPKSIVDISKNAPESIRSHVIRHDQLTTFLKNEMDKKSPVNFPDYKMYEIADTILSYRKDRFINPSEYYLPSEETPPPVDVVVPVEGPEDGLETDDKLKAALTQFRLDLARQTNRKAYHIFTNQTLEQLVAEKPTSLEELLRIIGMGPKKVEEFGEEILKIIHEHSLVPQK